MGPVVSAAVAYVAVITAVSDFLAPALPPSTLPITAVWAMTAAVALGLGALALVRRAPQAERLRNAVYTSALAAGHVPAWQSSPVQPTGARS